MNEIAAVSKVVDLFDRAERVSGKKPWIIGEGRELPYGVMADAIRRLSTHIGKSGWGRDARVILCSGDDFALMCWFMALVRNGVTAVIIDENLKGDELRALAGAAEPSAIIADEQVLDRIGGGAGFGVDIVAIEKNSRDYKYGGGGLFGGKNKGFHENKFPGLLQSEKPAKDLPDDISEDTVAYILFTSGTTSKPKGVEITHKNLFAQMETLVRQYGYTADSRILNILPLHHADGSMQGPVVAFVAQATACRPMEFSVDKVAELLDTVYALRITHFITVPSMLRLIADLGSDYEDSFDTDDFKCVVSTAAYLEEELWRRFEERFGVTVVNVYGLTETVCEMLYCGPDENTRKIGTVGKPVDCEARIVDSDGNDVAPGAKGEMILRGDNVMKGYFGLPDETAEILKDGWLHTGDLAQMDEDGFYAIVGRSKDVIIAGGFNIYPEDVNNTLKRLPGVQDAATFGVKDPVWGERVVSAIVPAPGNENIDTNALSAEFLEMASSEKLPREIFVLEELPRGPSGKVVAGELREITDRMRVEMRDAPHSEDIAERIMTMAARVFRVPQDELKPETGPDTLESWNSLAHVEFLLELEKEFSFKMSPQEIMRVASIRDSLKIVEQKLAS